jgi:N-acetyl-beta-hexosaminidase
MTWPRSLAIAETNWSPNEKKDWKKSETARHSGRVEEKGWREKITG